MNATAEPPGDRPCLEVEGSKVYAEMNQDGVLVAEFKRLVLVPRKGNCIPGHPQDGGSRSAESNVE